MSKSVWTSPPTLLSVDKATEGRRLSPDFFITRLPVELITQVVRHIKSSDLANFALTNKDCRQFARWRQFAKVTLLFPKSIGLTHVLLQELVNRSLNHGQSTFPCIGPCIRQAFIWSPDIDDYEQDGENAFLYVSTLKQILSTPSVVPQLHAIYWETEGELRAPESLELNFLCANQLKIQHLAVKGTLNDLNFRASRGCDWNLTSLWFAEDSARDIFNARFLEPGNQNILALASPTLVSLTMECPNISTLINDIGYTPSFPALRDFKMIDIDETELPVIEDILKSSRKLRLFESSPGTVSPFGQILDVSEHFELSGNFPELETFIWRTHNLETPYQPVPAVSFLLANPQIRTLSIPIPVELAWLENRLLPALGHSFIHLKSLHLSWPSPVPTDALVHISGLTNLEQICLAGKGNHRDRWTWNCNYYALLDHFRPLQKLRFIALVQDAGLQGTGQPHPYQDRWDSNTVSAWQKTHNRFIRLLLQDYAAVLPNLERAFMGQLDMRIKRLRDNASVEKLGEYDVDEMDVFWLKIIFGRWHNPESDTLRTSFSHSELRQQWDSDFLPECFFTLDSM